MPKLCLDAKRALTLCVGLFLNADSARGDDWPQWRGPNRDGVWRETGIMESFPANGLKSRWRASVSWGWASPVVADGRVFVSDAQIEKPKVHERIHCFAEADGKPQWTFSYETKYPDWVFVPGQERGPTATPIVRDGRVYAVGGLGDVHCLDARAGAVVWRKELQKQYEVPEFSTDASPLIEGNHLILMLGGRPGAGIVALDTRTGEEIWRALDEAATHSSPIIVKVAGKRQLIAWTQQSVASLDPANGKIHWRNALSTGSDFAIATPVAAGDRLLISGLMLRLDHDQPRATVQWPKNPVVTRRILSNTSTPLLQGGHVYSSKSSGELICLDAASGATVWTTNAVTDLKSGASIQFTPNGDSALLYNDRGELIHAHLTPGGFEEISRAKLIEPTFPFSGRKVAWAAAAFANGCVFARSDREVVCVDLRKAGVNGKE